MLLKDWGRILQWDTGTRIGELGPPDSGWVMAARGVISRDLIFIMFKMETL